MHFPLRFFGFFFYISINAQQTERYNGEIYFYSQY